MKKAKALDAIESELSAMAERDRNPQLDVRRLSIPQVHRLGELLAKVYKREIVGIHGEHETCACTDCRYGRIYVEAGGKHTPDEAAEFENLLTIASTQKVTQ